MIAPHTASCDVPPPPSHQKQLWLRQRMRAYSERCKHCRIHTNNIRPLVQVVPIGMPLGLQRVHRIHQNKCHGARLSERLPGAEIKRLTMHLSPSPSSPSLRLASSVLLSRSPTSVSTPRLQPCRQQVHYWRAAPRPSPFPFRACHLAYPASSRAHVISLLDHLTRLRGRVPCTAAPRLARL